jgi:DNA invertase Pin-like site-specific DNA recombinase
MTTRCALYVRVSTNRQEVENQLTQLREFAARQDWRVCREYIDHETGGTSNRAEFQQMFKDAARHKFQILLFWSLDRLSREGTFPTLQHLNRLADHCVGYRSFTEPYIDSCGIFKDVIVALLATLAKQEKIRISERTKAGLERARRQGKVLGRPKVRVDLAEIRALRASGMSWEAISQRTGIARATCWRAVTI